MARDVDWEAVERDFRLGRGSIREIARRYGIGHQSVLRHAKSGGWTRDMAPEVNRRVAERLLIGGPDQAGRTAGSDQADRKANPEPEAEREALRPGAVVTEADIEETVRERVAILREHQRVARDFRLTLGNLRGELDEVSAHRDEIIDDIEAETAGDKTVERRNRMLRAISLPSRAQAAAVLTSGVKNAVAVERQAHGMDNDPDGDPAASNVTVIELVAPDA